MRDAMEDIYTYLTKKRAYSILRTGDIICRKGNGIWSSTFCDMNIRDKRFSHAGIIIVTTNEKGNDVKVSVIHAEANDYTGEGKIIETDLAEFLYSSKGAAAYRLKQENATINNSCIFIQIARKYLNVPFDFHFDLSNRDKMYCTEYIYQVYTELTPRVELQIEYQNEKPYLPVDSCSNPLLFKEVLLFPNWQK